MGFSFNLPTIGAIIAMVLAALIGTYSKGYFDGKAAEHQRVVEETAREIARQSEINRREIEAANRRIQEIESEKDRAVKELEDAIRKAHEDPSGDDVGLNRDRVRDIDRLK